MLSPFVRRKMILALYRFDLSKNGFLNQEDYELNGQKVAELLKVNPGTPEYDRIVEAYRGLWQRYIAPADKDDDGRVSLEEYLETIEAFLQRPDAKQ